MDLFSNPIFVIMFLLLMLVFSLSVISLRIQKGNKLQKKSLEQTQIRTDDVHSALGIYFQGERTLGKCASCAELISIEAKICKACGTNVESQMLQINQSLAELKKKREINQIKSRDNRVRSIKKVSLILAIVLPISIGASVLVPIVKNSFFPSKIQKLAKEWEKVLSECGFSEVEVIVDENDYNGGIYADGKFKSTPEKKDCLKSKLDIVYTEFNTVNNEKASWFIGNVDSGSWENDYADSMETYTLTHYPCGFYSEC